jgi:hypothetical protein
MKVENGGMHRKRYDVKVIVPNKTLRTLIPLNGVVN